jgi:steroid 5-alpha reductase family enzyme
MVKTIIVLIVTLIVVPLVSFYFDEPLSPEQWSMLHTCLLICGGVALSCFALSEITRNCSQVDKIWSIVPIAYVWVVACAGDWNPRMVLMAVLVTLWGARLTYNFSRRGAYSWKFWSGEEDYRWGVLREMPALKGRFRWMLFNLFFISLYQNGLILLFTLPIVFVQSGANEPLNGLDWLAMVMFLAFLVIETVADQQQWTYQNEKYRRIKAGERLTGEYAKGFVATGLWKVVRHPNYMAEQAIWISFYLFTVAATGRWLNWSIAGCLLLLVLFQGSSDFSEKISAGKYPEYKQYQKKVGRFLPRLW